MAEIKWIKITTNMFDDEKIKLIDAMPERDTIHYIWIRLLVQAGKTNANGYIFLNENVPYTEEMLSTIFNRPLNTVRLALKTLSSFEMIHIQEDKLIKISNWDKHQNIEGMEKIKEQNRIRKQKQRERKKQIEAPTQNEVTGTNEESECDVTGQSRDIHAIEQEQETDIDNSCCCSNTHVHEKEISDSYGTDPNDYQKNEQGTVPNTHDGDIQDIINHYCNRANILEINLKPKDYETAIKLVTKIPLTTIIKGIDWSFENYKPKFSGDKINSLAYCEPIIYSSYERERLREAGNDDAAGNGSGGRSGEWVSKKDNGNETGMYDFSKFGG